MKLHRKLISLIFNISKSSLKRISLQNPDWMVAIVISEYVAVGEESENWDEADTYETIIDDALENDNPSYIEEYYQDMMTSLERMRNVAKGDLFVYEDKGRNGHRNFFIATKEQQNEIIDFLLWLGWKKPYIEINPDWDKEIENALEDFEEAKKEAEYERNERESMRRSSYRW